MMATQLLHHYRDALDILQIQHVIYREGIDLMLEECISAGVPLKQC